MRALTGLSTQILVPDLHVVDSTQFTGVSVTAEKWIELEEVSEPQLPAWLRQARAQVRCLSFEALHLWCSVQLSALSRVRC